MTPTGKSALPQEHTISFQAFGSVSSNLLRTVCRLGIFGELLGKSSDIASSLLYGELQFFEDVRVCLSRRSKLGLLFVGAPAGTVGIWLKKKGLSYMRPLVTKKCFNPLAIYLFHEKRA